MTSPGSKSRIRWEADTNKTIKKWPEEVRSNIGGDLDRLDNDQEPLDAKPTQPQIPGANELRDRHENNLYRLIYWLRSRWIYVIHCFEKDTDTIPQNVADTAKKRMSNIRARKDAPYQDESKSDESESQKGKKSA